MDMRQKLTELLIGEGASDLGFSKIYDFKDGFENAITLVVKLSPAIIEEIVQEPTHTYFNHYRTVNAFIDRCLLKAGLMLQREGYRYITVAASQSVNIRGNPFNSMYSHKKAAVASGLGFIGKNALFIHKEFGPAVRLGTIFTDCNLNGSQCEPVCLCGECLICVRACPAMALTGRGEPEKGDMIDRRACSDYMKEKFMHIGRGSVCGICISSCPKKSKI